MYTITRYTEKVDNVIILVQGVNSVFELKTNEEIGAYLKKLILSKYPSCRQFCVAYIDLRIDFSDDPQDLRSDEIRKLTNRLSQILKGKKVFRLMTCQYSHICWMYRVNKCLLQELIVLRFLIEELTTT